MRIAIVVHGRFHAFDLARALLDRGHDVVLFTNYPRWAVRRFGLPAACVRSCWLHGVATRAIGRLRSSGWHQRAEPILHQWFGRWAARSVGTQQWDVVHSWSGVSEELLAAPRRSGFMLLMRGSAHIATQRALLDEESRRSGAALDRPSEWMIAREEREYVAADAIAVLSGFARQTFLDRAVNPEKVWCLPLGVDTAAFAPGREVIDARAARVRAGRPLTVLVVGTLSFQKGALDLAAIIDGVDPHRFVFRLVGTRLPEVESIFAKPRANVVQVGKVPQSQLPGIYDSGDVFLLPTIQDGFAVVLAQALAAGLPVITTTNSGGPDMVREGVDGWVVPIRHPDLVIERLAWCDAHRTELAAMVAAMGETDVRRWSAVAADFERLCEGRTVAAGNYA